MAGMKNILLILLIAGVSGQYAWAQFKGVQVEELDNSGYVPGRTYRVYIQLAGDSDQVHMVYGDEKHILEISSTQPFYQSESAGAFSTDVNRKRASEDPLVRYDSWLTIGAEDNYGNGTTNFLLLTEEFEKHGGPIRTSDGAWFCLPGKPQTYGGPERRVLIGQFTTTGALSGRISVMGRTASGEVFHQYDVRFTSPAK
jgi:hypothetical protein